MKELVSRVGTSSTGVTVKEIFEELELEPSVAVKVKVAEIVFKSEFAFSSIEKIF